MKRLIEETNPSGLESLLGEKVLLLCSAYFYTGKLTGVNDTFVELTDPAIVYQTGDWKSKTYEDVQPLHTKTFFIQRAAIESFGVSK